ncbi:MAG: hypothetical protein ACRDJU_08305 [Actinomycetota bacterium]
MVTCVGPSVSTIAGCGPMMTDFRSRYAPPLVALANSAVPWAALPLQAEPDLFIPATDAPKAGVAACTGSQLSAADSGLNGGGGTSVYKVDLTNVSATPRLLSGFPTSLTGLRANGQGVDLHPSQASLGLFGIRVPGILAPGATGAALLATENACIGVKVLFPGSFSPLRIGLPGGGTVSASPTSTHTYSFLAEPWSPRSGSRQSLRLLPRFPP